MSHTMAYHILISGEEGGGEADAAEAVAMLLQLSVSAQASDTVVRCTVVR